MLSPLGVSWSLDLLVGKILPADFQAYRLGPWVLVLQRGWSKFFLESFVLGILGEFFPTSAVHGLLTAIGVIIMAKQFPVALGVKPRMESLWSCLPTFLSFIMDMNPLVGLIGIISLLIMFGYMLSRIRRFKVIPPPWSCCCHRAAGDVFESRPRADVCLQWAGLSAWENDFLVAVPENLFHAITFPDFSGLLTTTGWKYVIMFALIGSIESLLSAKAIDGIDPWKRKTDHDRDMLAVGVGNTLAAFVGGLPMISEIVRSKANIDNGARTRFANMFHGLFLLLFVALLPGLINQIPLAALGAMLVFTGFSISFAARIYPYCITWAKEQFIIFVSTVIGVLATDLLMGIAIGICVNIVLHLKNGAPMPSLFKPQIQVERDNGRAVIVKVRDSAIFSTWIALKKTLDSLASEPHVILDLSDTFLVDHTTMSKLMRCERNFKNGSLDLKLRG